MTTPTATQIRIRVPSNHLMVDLLGERDTFLKQVDAVVHEGVAASLTSATGGGYEGEGGDQHGHSFHGYSRLGYPSSSALPPISCGI